jgi:hypothetical protein
LVTADVQHRDNKALGSGVAYLVGQGQEPSPSIFFIILLEDGFEYQSQHYRSLSAVAREVTGTHWNGLSFFGLTERRDG